MGAHGTRLNRISSTRLFAGQRRNFEYKMRRLNKHRKSPSLESIPSIHTYIYTRGSAELWALLFQIVLNRLNSSKNYSSDLMGGSETFCLISKMLAYIYYPHKFMKPIYYKFNIYILIHNRDVVNKDIYIFLKDCLKCYLRVKFFSYT